MEVCASVTHRATHATRHRANLRNAGGVHWAIHLELRISRELVDGRFEARPPPSLPILGAPHKCRVTRNSWPVGPSGKCLRQQVEAQVEPPLGV
eukprot:scaffold21907_cov57-Phaeocystis_antarctica.AAC.12